MKKHILTSAMLLCAAFASAQQGTVKLKGKILDIPAPVLIEYDGASSALGDIRAVTIPVAGDGSFELTLPLGRPGYYRIMRSFLWLTPGDDMEVFITPDQTEGTFKGRGAEANAYLTGRLFPKGGSFLLSGSNVKADFAATRSLVDSLAEARLRQLNSLEGVSEEFRALETARVRADLVNSYLAYPFYAEEWSELPADSVGAHAERLYHELLPRIQTLISQFADERFLDVGVVRDVMSLMAWPRHAYLFEGVAIPERTRELAGALMWKHKLSGKPDAATVASARGFVAGMEQPDFKREMERALADLDRLGKGTPAVDMELEQPDGTKKKLSDLKGRMLCIDLWATWCGPCLAEAPAFAALAGEFRDSPVLFLQISTDNDRKAWENFLKAQDHGPALQFLSGNNQLLREGWMLSGIPRFILIDKDFRIIDADAPRPSGGELSRLIRENLPVE